MYLPSFYKTKNELQAWKLTKYSKAGPALLLWGVWAFYPALYNLIFTDIFPPAKGNQFINFSNIDLIKKVFKEELLNEIMNNYYKQKQNYIINIYKE